MIITKTPVRISFVGGGTDFKEFFKENKGSVISSTINKYCYVMVRDLPEFFDYTNEISYSKVERTKDIETIEHPTVREAMKLLDVDHVRVTYEADLPARSGLGTSSSFAVGMLNGFHELKGQTTNKKQLADEAIHLERVLCNEIGGWQDQIAVSFGGLNRIDFRNDSYEVSPINITNERKKQLNDNLLLFFTGFTRISSVVHEENNIVRNDNTKCLKEMLKLVDDVQEVLTNPEKDLDEFGKILDLEWKLKKQLSSNISTDLIDEIYRKGLKAGALGGKLLGAGEGGFILFYANNKNKQNVINALNDLIYVPFGFEEDGTKIIYNNEILEKH